MKTKTDTLGMIEGMKAGELIIGGPEGNQADGAQVLFEIHRLLVGYRIYCNYYPDGDSGEKCVRNLNCMTSLEAFEWMVREHLQLEVDVEKTTWMKRIDEKRYLPL